MRTVLVRVQPPQPTLTQRAAGTQNRLILNDRESGFGPAAPAAVHGNHVAVAHFLEIVRRERRAEPAAAVEYEGRFLVRDGFLDVAFNHAFAQVNRTGDVPARPFGFLARVHDDDFFAAVQPLFRLAKTLFLDPRLRVSHQLQKSFGMIHSHRSTSWSEYVGKTLTRSARRRHRVRGENRLAAWLDSFHVAPVRP